MVPHPVELDPFLAVRFLQDLVPGTQAVDDCLLLAVDPKVAEVAKEIRQRTQVVLRNPANHEGARH